MLGVMIIFAFAMGLVINFGERMVRHHKEEEANPESENGEVFATEKVTDKPE